MIPEKLQIDRHKFLVYGTDTIKELYVGEEEPAREIIQTLEKYELKAVDTTIHQLNFSDLEDTGKIIILLLVFNEYPPQIFGTINIRELLENIESNNIGFIFSMESYLQYLKETHELPEHLERYFSFSNFLEDAEKENKIASFQVIDRYSQDHKATFIIERTDIEEVFYEIGL